MKEAERSGGIPTRTTIYDKYGELARITPQRVNHEPHFRLAAVGNELMLDAETAHAVGRALMEHAEAVGVDHDTSELTS